MVQSLWNTEETKAIAEKQVFPVLTCVSGSNADVFLHAVRFYLPAGSRIADVTYGKGVFWQKVPSNTYELVKSDLISGVNFCRLPQDQYADASFDAFVLDPPYMHGGDTVKASINDRYRNANTSHESVVALYCGGFLEARRVLKKNGLLFVKCQAEIESGKQRQTPHELITVLNLIGFRIEDEFVLHQSAVPAMREKYQIHARKNHSSLFVARFIR